MKLFIPGRIYQVSGGFLHQLEKVASTLSSGEKIDADRRRDMAQWIQAQLDRAEMVPDLWE
jgi:hypothetical protein